MTAATPPIPYRASNFDGVLTLAPNWVQAEFNIFGACCKHQANFNSGATLTVRTSVNDGTPNAYCTEPGFTAETNNLTLGQCSAIGGALPAIVFTEAQLDPPPPPIFSPGPGTYLCAQTVSISDPGATIFPMVAPLRNLLLSILAPSRSKKPKQSMRWR